MTLENAICMDITEASRSQVASNREFHFYNLFELYSSFTTCAFLAVLISEL